MKWPPAGFWRRFAVGAAAAIAVGLAAYLAARTLARPAASHPWFAPRPGDHRPLVFAHQGGERLHPSNTLAGFRHARTLGADVLDTDVHLTKDGVLVLMHDTTVNRTTNGNGAVRDLTLAEIRQLDAGYRFTRDRGKTYPFRGNGLTVPTLEELFREFPGRRFGVEIKATSPEAGQKLAALIRQHGLEERVLVSSFHQAPMDALRAASPQVATSATADEVRTFLVLSWLRLVDAYTPRYQALQVPERRGSIQILTPRFLADAHRRNLPVVPWTINGAANLRRVIAMGVAGINTDEPDRLLELLAVATHPPANAGHAAHEGTHPMSPQSKNISDDSADREIVITRVFDAPRQRVFEAFTDPKHISSWWGPRGFRTTTHEYNLKPGGMWRFIMHAPDGKNYDNRITFTEVVPGERLTYGHGSDLHVDPNQFRVVVTFADELGGKTRVVFRMIRATKEQRDEMIRFGAVEGGEQTLARLSEHIGRRTL